MYTCGRRSIPLPEVVKEKFAADVCEFESSPSEARQPRDLKEAKTTVVFVARNMRFVCKGCLNRIRKSHLEKLSNSFQLFTTICDAVAAGFYNIPQAS
jgi:hypothetical protein